MNEQTTMILIDTALASGSASALDAEERKLQELVLAVRDDAPVADPQFELRMNARVAAGFPRKGRQHGRIRTLLSTRPQLAAMGAAASLLIALVVGLSAIGGGSDPTTSSSTGGAGSAAESAQAPAPNAAGGSTAGTEQAAPAAKATAPRRGIGAGSPARPLPPPAPRRVVRGPH